MADCVMATESWQRGDERRPRVLVCDDDPIVHALLGHALGNRFALAHVTHAAGLWAHLSERCAGAVILDLRLDDGQGGGGFDLIGAVRRAWPRVPVIIHSGLCDHASVVRAMRLGADDYVPKSRDVTAIERALERWMRTPGRAPQAAVGRPVLKSAASHALWVATERLAAGDGHVLVLGEPGSGKTTAAHAVGRAAHQRTVIDAAALSSTPPGGTCSRLFERVGRPGAQVVLIENVAALPTWAQRELLAALEEAEARRAGAGEAARAGARVISTSRQDLDALARAGAFDVALLLRLSTWTLSVPPLRDRRDDVRALAEYVVERLGRRDLLPLGPAVVAHLEAGTWPGNIRELAQAVRTMVRAAGDRTPEPAHLPGGRLAGDAGRPANTDPDGAPADVDVEGSYRENMRRHERLLLRRAYQAAGGNIGEMAARTGLNRTYLYDKLKRLHLLGRR